MDRVIAAAPRHGRRPPMQIAAGEDSTATVADDEALEIPGYITETQPGPPPLRA